MTLSTLFQLNRSGQCMLPCFPEVWFTSSRYGVLFKPMAAFPYNYCQSNGQKSESCHNDYHQSSKKILTESGMEPGQRQRERQTDRQTNRQTEGACNAFTLHANSIHGRVWQYKS